MATIYETLQSMGSFPTFMRGLQEAGLVQTLKDAGPFTVFVPTEAAFAKVDPDKRQKALSRGEKLTKVMQYHIVPGFYTTNDLLDHLFLKTLEGQRLMLDSMISQLPDKEQLTKESDAYHYIIQDQITSTIQQSITVDNATIIQADLRCDNGVIHTIDTVLVPKLVLAF
jgi:uncharacterized surface protein with fasciclin (FAS1) repeats